MVRAFFKLLKDLHTYQKDRGSIYKHKFSPGKEGGEKDLFTFYNKENSVLFFIYYYNFPLLSLSYSNTIISNDLHCCFYLSVGIL